MFIIFILVKHGQEDVPYWVKALKYITVCCFALTFVTVYLVLIPMTFSFANYLTGLKEYGFTGSMLFTHTLAPILAMVSFVFFEGDRRLNKKKTIYVGMIPTYIYGFVFIILNILGIVDGPYPFLRVNYQPWYMSVIWVIAIFLVDYVLARMILLENQKHAHRVKRK